MVRHWQIFMTTAIFPRRICQKKLSLMKFRERTAPAGKAESNPLRVLIHVSKTMFLSSRVQQALPQLSYPSRHFLIFLWRRPMKRLQKEIYKSIIKRIRKAIQKACRHDCYFSQNVILSLCYKFNKYLM